MITTWSEGKTHEFDRESKRANFKQHGRLGELFINDQEPIMLEINGKALILPPMERLVIGRRSNSSPDIEPDIALNAFNAEEKGVSRRHIRIQRAGKMVYMTDLCSSNGTYLNGRLLTPNAKAILRSGDEFCLGRLTIRVVFMSRNAQ